MPEFECKDCGAANPADAQFCCACGYYLGWDSAPPTTSPAVVGAPAGSTGVSPTATATEASRAAAPQVKLEVSDVEVQPGAGAGAEMRVRNNSTIVDAYRVEVLEPPGWLVIEQPEIRLMPNEDRSVTATFKLADGSFVEAQTRELPLRISSLRDPTKFTDAKVRLTVQRYGPPVTIRVRPEVVRLEDKTEGRVAIFLDNSASNYPHRIRLAAYDSEAVVSFHFSSPSVEVVAGGDSTVELDFTVPALQESESRTRQLTISATEDDHKDEAIVSVNQARSATVPLKLRLEPSVLRVEDCPIADLTLVIDNREGKRDRSLTLEGRDPQGAVRFSFATPQLVVAAGTMAKTRLSVSAPAPKSGAEVSRPFSVVAMGGDDENEASGTFAQVTSELPIKVARLQIAPETLRRRNKSTGRYHFVIENGDDSQWLTADMFGSDLEGVVRFSFSPGRVELPPGGSAAGWVAVSAPHPERGSVATRQLRIGATDGGESVSTTAVFAHSAGDWIPILRTVLTLIAAVLVLLGAFTPWMTRQDDYYVTQLPLVLSSDLVKKHLPAAEGLKQARSTDSGETTQATDTVQSAQTAKEQEMMRIAQTQITTRATVILLAVLMAAGVLSRDGRLTMSSAMLVAAGLAGYFVYVSMEAERGPGYLMYGAYFVVAGALIGFAGGVLARYQTRS